MTTIEQILDLARWAPSGDNEQPWRFEIIDDTHFIIHGHDTRSWCVYDLDGHASQIAIGALLQTIEIAASGLQYQVIFSKHPNFTETTPTFTAKLVEAPGMKPSESLPFIETRSTQRRAMKTTPLTLGQKQQLEQAVGENYKITWLEGHSERWAMAKLLFKSAHIRLTIPEAYQVHKKNIEWNTQFSEDRIPDQAIGVDALTLKIMRWTLKSWERVQFMNRFLLGTVPPRIQMDLIPGYRCAAHFCIHSKQALEAPEDYIDGGKALQQFWLTATQLGLELQPEMTPLIFSRFSDKGLVFSKSNNARAEAAEISKTLSKRLQDKHSPSHRVFIGRLGFGATASSRSVRKTLPSLILKSKK